MKATLTAILIGASVAPVGTPQQDDFIEQKCSAGCYIVPAREYEGLIEDNERMEKTIRGLVQRIEKERKWCQPERI